MKKGSSDGRALRVLSRYPVVCRVALKRFDCIESERVNRGERGKR